MSFSPYNLNGGTIVCVSGNGYTIAASDSRLSDGFQILSRDNPKLYQLTSKTVLASTGCHCDVLTLIRQIKARITLYEHEHKKEMSTAAIAQMLSTILYYKRFFPYYVYNILAGIDENGEGCVYSYDPVGSYEREAFRAAGTGSELVQPLLDNQVGMSHQGEAAAKKKLSLDCARQVVMDAFISATERDIYTGDGVYMAVVTPDGVAMETHRLRRD